MVILIPWKPVVAAWCLLAAVLWIGYLSYSILEGKNPFAMAKHHSSYSTANRGIHAKSEPK